MSYKIYKQIKSSVLDVGIPFQIQGGSSFLRRLKLVAISSSYYLHRASFMNKVITSNGLASFPKMLSISILLFGIVTSGIFGFQIFKSSLNVNSPVNIPSAPPAPIVRTPPVVSSMQVALPKPVAASLPAENLAPGVAEALTQAQYGEPVPATLPLAGSVALGSEATPLASPTIAMSAPTPIQVPAPAVVTPSPASVVRPAVAPVARFVQPVGGPAKALVSPAVTLKMAEPPARSAAPNVPAPLVKASELRNQGVVAGASINGVAQDAAKVFSANTLATVHTTDSKAWIRINDNKTVILQVGETLPGSPSLGRLISIDKGIPVFERGVVPKKQEYSVVN